MEASGRPPGATRSTRAANWSEEASPRSSLSGTSNTNAERLLRSSRPTIRRCWSDLYAAQADVVLNGHKHNYERLTKLNPSGAPATNGIREIIAGTGGENHSISRKLYPGAEASDGGHFGILEMTLHPAGYDLQFVSGTGTLIDRGSPAFAPLGHPPAAPPGGLSRPASSGRTEGGRM